MTVTIYHNPRCSKSRQTLGLLQENNVEPQIVEYLKTPPDAATLGKLLDMLGLRRAQGRKKKKRQGKGQRSGPVAVYLIAAMVSIEKLIERPDRRQGYGKSGPGRPRESVLHISATTGLNATPYILILYYSRHGARRTARQIARGAEETPGTEARRAPSLPYRPFRQARRSIRLRAPPTPSWTICATVLGSPWEAPPVTVH